MPETIIESVLKGKLTYEVLVKWLNDEVIEDTPEYCALLCCNRSEFVTYFLSFLRNQTDSILQTNSKALNLIQQQSTPEKIISSRRKHRRSISEPTTELEADHTDSLSVKTDRQRSHESPNRDRSNQKKSGRRVKTKLFNDNEKSKDQSSSFLSSKTDSDESRLSVGVENLVISSTPLKNGMKPSDYPNLSLTSPVTPQSRNFGNFERCDTPHGAPRVNHRHSKSQDKSSFGDFLANASTGKSSKKKRVTPKNISNEAESVNKGGLDFSSSEMFPEIGTRKSSSLRSEKKRIKPTNIDNSTPQKSHSLNSFTSESFQQPSPLTLEDNLAFKHQKFQPKELANSFDAERSILKQERHKLMEKFNILNTSSTQKTQVTPQIKITRKNSVGNQQNHVNADFSKVKLKEKIDLLVEIYDILLKNNLILSTTSEIYFLISILLSQQYEEDYLNAESNLNEENAQYILKSIHNSTYFAVKSLWHQKHILEFMLDKNSMKIFGENKKVRSFCPELAKFLLNLYGIKSESETTAKDKVIVLENRFTNGMVCFNFETDNAENFPSLLSFQNFKKQRDMFYEILRWYTESQPTGTAKSTFRTRVKTLLSLAITPANHAHLARLFTAHMLSECLPTLQRESKLSKLHRRLTGPATHESHRLSRFTNKEMFYKEFIMFAENESFRVHLRDSLCSEICVLDCTAIGSTEDRGNSNPEVSKEYLQLLRKLRLLSKFLGFLTALPYTQIPIEYTIKTGSVNCMVQKETTYVVPKEKVLENDIAMRNHSQPTIDLKSMVIEANVNRRLCITIPWIVQYLSMLDYTTLRLKYYQELLKHLFEIYVQKLKISNESIKRSTIIFLKLTLGLLCDLPHFPQELFYEKAANQSNMASSVASDEHLDSLEVIDESIVFEVCPFLRDINVLLLTSKPSQEVKDVGSFRHITPVSLSLNPEDRIRNKEKEIQARLEEEFLKGQPSSTRRVIEVITERVTSSCVKHVCAVCIREARGECTRNVAALLKRSSGTQAEILPSVREVYSRQLVKLRAKALDVATSLVSQRAGMALQALVACGNSKKALTAVVSRACMNRISKWLQDHWDSTDVLCKDIAGEMKNLLVLGDSVLSEERRVTSDVDTMKVPGELFERAHVSPTTALVDIKEQICLLLDYEEPVDLARVLSECASACRRDNLFTRPPAQRALLHLTLDLCVVYVSRKPWDITESFLSQLDRVWSECCTERRSHHPPELELERRLELEPEFRNFESEELISSPISDEETDTNDPSSGQTVINSENNTKPNSSETKPNNSDTTPNNSVTKPNYSVTKPNNSNVIIVNSTPIIPSNVIIATNNPIIGNSNVIIPKSPITPMESKDDGSEFLEYFDRVLCPRNIVLLSASKCKASDVWEAMATVLVFLLTNHYLNEDSLTEQCLAVYRQDWPQNILENLSTCMKSVSSKWRTSAGKFTLFLDFLAEFCGDMDYESFDMG